MSKIKLTLMLLLLPALALAGQSNQDVPFSMELHGSVSAPLANDDNPGPEPIGRAWGRRRVPDRIAGVERIGIKVGTGLSSLNGFDVGTDVEEAPARSIGLTFGYRLSKVLVLQTEALYAVRGGVQHSTLHVYDRRTGFFLFDQYAATDWTIHYLEVPILFRLQSYTPGRGGMASGGGFGFLFEYGGSFGFLLDKSTKDTFTSSTDTDPSNYRVNHVRFGAVEFSFVIGIGGVFEMGPGSLEAQFRFSAGIANMGNHPDKANTLSYAVMIGYGLPLR